MFSTLVDLISIESISGQEEEIGLYIRDHIGRMGLETEVYRVYDGGSNIIARIGDGEPRIIVETHMDVAPSLDMKNAFTPKIDGDIVYGRGACDVKGGMVSTFIAIEKLLSMEKALPHQIIFAYVVDEEQGGRGASNLIENGITGEYGIIMEPTNLTVSISASGCIEFKVSCIGESGHGASGNGKNAVLGLVKFLENLLYEEIVNEEGDLQNMRSLLNIGRFSGGVDPWMIPSYAEAECLLHFLPIHRVDEVREWLEVFTATQNELLDMEFSLDITHQCEGYALNRDDPWVRIVGEKCREKLGIEKIYSHMTSESDANQLYHRGGVKCIVFGPGDIRNAHSLREHVDVNQVIKAGEILTEILKTPVPK